MKMKAVRHGKGGHMEREGGSKEGNSEKEKRVKRKAVKHRKVRQRERERERTRKERGLEVFDRKKASLREGRQRNVRKKMKLMRRGR